MKRQTFLDDPTNEGIRHLRIVISDPSPQREYLTVPLDTLRHKFQDASCVIQKGEHPFVKATSFINYKYAKALTFSQIFNGIYKGFFIRKEDVSQDLLLRIQNGAKTTKFLKNELKAFFQYF